MDPTHPSPTSEAALPENELGHRRRVKELADQIAELFKDVGGHMRELRAIGVPTSDWVDLMMRQFSERTQDQFGDSAKTVVPMLLDLAVTYLEGGDVPEDAEGKTVAIGLELGNLFGKHLTWDKAFGLLKAAVPLIMGGFGKSAPAAFPQGMAHEDCAPPQLSAEEREQFLADNERAMMASYTPETVRMKKVIERMFGQAPKMTDASGKDIEGQAPALECHVTLKAGVQAQGALSTTPEGGLRLLSPNQIPQERGQPPKFVMIEHFFDYDQVADIAVIREVKASEPSRIVSA